jgi:acetolactate synthase I/II/III large subunit
MPERITVGELTARFIEACGVQTAFGVISIHNMPILDAIGCRGKVRYVPARGEAGAVNMADANARVTGGLGVALTSTGTAAGNAAGAMVEATTAGTPVLHLTGQIDVPYLDRDLGYIHEARDQLNMLRAVSKAAFRIESADTALATLREAAQVALTAPRGPVSVEIPIDVQKAEIDLPGSIELLNVQPMSLDEAALDQLANRLAECKRPLLWLGGGTRNATDACKRLVDLGFGVVSSTQGRGVIADSHPSNLGAFTAFAQVEAFYETCDAMLVVGSRLRGNETLTYKLNLPKRLFRIDADPARAHGEYIFEQFVHADAAQALDGLANKLEGRLKTDNAFGADLATARREAETFARDGLGPYNVLVDAVADVAGESLVWVRDVTLLNSTWGNRLPALNAPRNGVHALGGGIGQGLPMAIGAALAVSDRPVIALVGDGGLQLNIGELATAAQEHANFTLVVMNSHDYGVIHNIQDAHYGGRKMFADILTPDFGKTCESVGVNFRRVTEVADAASALSQAMAVDGPAVVEIDMREIGPFARTFAGPPVRTQA